MKKVTWAPRYKPLGFDVVVDVAILVNGWVRLTNDKGEAVAQPPCAFVYIEITEPSGS